ncbi:MAG: thioredoxin-dependent thiol peroxidase [Flavobacteriales bacterium CG_4_10_14_0_2_um_filter_32_8]|nr:MAG: thioredoxin-dependent thiol peroxidase [Flavobacteriales bacterium CG_4_10_14_0_2_um_filter_32_8]PJB14728.1 MAG: thioredoxin-dependent thiol peroxidase [Flavobacteriales bacterium CG_4_9_14_3_um_filter_32_8]
MMHLKEGDKAPELNITDQNGKVHQMTDYLGKKVILYFYPKDLTPGCTVESCDLRDNYEKLKSDGFEVIGVSADAENKHQRFIEKHHLPFNLLADTNKEVLNRYGVWGEKKFMGKTYDGIHRTTFVINKKGIIEKIISKVKTKHHTQQIREELSTK